MSTELSVMVMRVRLKKKSSAKKKFRKKKSRASRVVATCIHVSRIIEHSNANIPYTANEYAEQRLSRTLFPHGTPHAYWPKFHIIP